MRDCSSDRGVAARIEEALATVVPTDAEVDVGPFAQHLEDLSELLVLADPVPVDGVLKAVGAPKLVPLYRIVVFQSLLVGLAGSVLGIAMSALAVSLIGRWVPEFVTDLRALDATGVFAAAVLMSIIASSVPGATA